MSLAKLSKMVNAKNAMSLDFGKMLYEYMETVTSRESAQSVRKRDGIAKSLSDGQLSSEEIFGSEYLDMGSDQWSEMGGYSKREDITKLTFITAMRRFCSEAAECRKDVSKCE